MSFADELRSIPDKQKKEDELQRSNDWDKLKYELYNRIKAGCLSAAKEGSNGHYTYFDDLLNQIDEEIQKDSQRYDTRNKKRVQWWERIKKRLYRQLTPTSKLEPKAYLWEAEYNELSTCLVELLTKDGLQVIVKPSRWEKKRFGYKNGRLQFVNDGYAYKFTLNISW